MSVPASRQTSSAARRRRANIHLEKKTLVKCPKCGKPKTPHTACKFCGTYKGKAVIKVKTKAAKKKKTS